MQTLSQPHPQVVPHHAVHPDLLVPHGVVRQHDADALPASPSGCSSPRGSSGSSRPPRCRQTTRCRRSPSSSCPSAGRCRP